eukprot:TRINITY_DN5176_c0_g1_i2.p1 TRINITY_DN5176_c0_g1~~TRINITY_DN5176_c0_g1_i2.p1  ORF type:complete len:343 (+),score=47.16 TRINITY_DN5176_c0_g1_i2:126-1154(+)
MTMTTNQLHFSFPARVLRERLARSDQRSDSWNKYLPLDFMESFSRDGKFNSADLYLAGGGSFGTRASVFSSDLGGAKDEAHRPHMSFAGNVWELCQIASGSRLVQEAMDSTSDKEQVFILMMELKDHMWDAMRNPHANFVLQKFIPMASDENVQFIIDIIAQSNLEGQAARHKYACRIVQRLIEKCGGERMTSVTERLTDDFLALSCHPYGNYIAQHLIEYGTEAQRSRMCRVTCSSMRELCLDNFGCNVVICMLAKSCREHQLALSYALAVEEQQLLSYMACNRSGYRAVIAVLGILPEDDRRQVVKFLFESHSALCACRYGRAVIGAIASGETILEGGIP